MANVVINSCHDCPFVSFSGSDEYKCLLPVFVNGSSYIDVTDDVLEVKQNDECILFRQSVSFHSKLINLEG